MALSQVISKLAAQKLATKKKPKPNAKAPLGQGGRFAAIEEKAEQGGARNPAAVAAAAGNAKYGKKRMQAMAQKGKR